MLRRLSRAAVLLVAVIVFALSTATVWAIDKKTPFDFDPKAPARNGNYDFDYGSLDDKGTFGDSTKSKSRGPALHVNSGTDRRTNLGGPSNVVPGGH
jgi:hypothetical protein